MRIPLVLLLAALASPAAAQSLALIGKDGRKAAVTAAEFAAMPHVKVHVTPHGEPHDYEGVPLAALLEKVGVSVAKPLGGRDLAGAVRATAADGYQIVLAISEVDPATRKATVIVADREAGKPLADGEGPLRLVVEDDLRPARSARQLVKIEVIDLATSAKKARAK